MGILVTIATRLLIQSSQISKTTEILYISLLSASFHEAPTKNTGPTLFTNISHYKSLGMFGCMKMMTRLRDATNKKKNGSDWPRG